LISCKADLPSVEKERGRRKRGRRRRGKEEERKEEEREGRVVRL
jgi:hypothetical protein